MEKCIDISKHQSAFNPAISKAKGVNTIICRFAYAGSQDVKLAEYFTAARNCGLKVGGYGFATWHYKDVCKSNLGIARSVMQSQVNAWIRMMKQYPPDSWFGIDQEMEKGHTMGLSMGDNTALLNEAAKMIEDAGFHPCLYTGAAWCDSNVKLSVFKYPLWIAYYKWYGVSKDFDTAPETFPANSGTWGRFMNKFKDRICMWQYTSEGFASSYGCTHASNNLDKNWLYYSPSKNTNSSEVKPDMSRNFDEYCLFPMDCLRVTQGCGFAIDGVKASTYSHLYQTAYDIAGEDTGKSVVYAPFSCKVVRVYNGSSAASKCNFTWYMNTKRVMGANGIVYAPGTLFFMTAHCDTSFMNAHNIRKGVTFAQGKICGSEGTAGASGAHCHITFGTGTWDGKGWHEIPNRRGSWEINNPVYMHRVCYLKPTCVVKNGFGYPWKVLSGSQTSSGVAGTTTIQPSQPSQSGNMSGDYFKRYTGNSSSITIALKMIGEDNSFSYRSKIAAANGIANYTGTAAQNLQMVGLLKQGRLLKIKTYFKKYTGSSGSITIALKAIGEDSSYSYRSKVAAANGIREYRGSAQQNLQMVDMLKKGILVKP